MKFLAPAARDTGGPRRSPGGEFRPCLRRQLLGEALGVGRKEALRVPVYGELVLDRLTVVHELLDRQPGSAECHRGRQDVQSDDPVRSVSLAATSSDNPRVSSMKPPKMMALGMPSRARYPTTVD